MELQAYQPGPGKAGRPATGRLQRHPLSNSIRRAPSREMAPKTAIQRACACLWPWVNAAVYPGIRRGLYELFQGRAAVYTIRDWRRGKRVMPQWARDILIAELEKKMAALGTAIAELKNER